VNIVRFEMNVPTEVALQSPEGVCVAGRYGNRMMFHLADGRVMYVPPIVASKIEEAGIAAGECFHLCKASVKTGQRRSVEWLLERIDPDQAQPLAGPPTDTAETALENDLRLSIEMANAKRAGLETEPADSVEQTPPFAPSDDGHVYNGHESNGHGGNNNGGGLKIIPNPSPPITKLEHALKTAISAAHNAEKFGAELGYVVRFDADAIKSMAITVLINMSERVQR
jgi:hypothetical protein